MGLRKVGLGIAVLACLAQPLGGQAQSSLTPCAIYATQSFGQFLISQATHPLTATIKSTFEQTLSDGNHISLTAMTKVARDSSGRIRSESISHCALNDRGIPLPVVFVQISDPAAKTNTTWFENDELNREVVIRHAATPLNTPMQVRSPEAVAASKRHIEHAVQETAQENLGIRTIAGVEAKGMRTTRTYSTDEVGATQPVIVRSERWQAATLPTFPLLTITDDPRTGRSTTEVTDLVFGDPDPALFELPKDRPVEEITFTSAKVQKDLEKPTR